MFKRVSKLIVSILIVTLAALPVSAAESAHNPPQDPASLNTGIITPLWEQASTIQTSLYMNGSTASCRANVYGNSTVQSIYVTMTLYNSNGSYMSSWAKSGSYYVDLSGSFSNCQRGSTYYVKATYTLTSKSGARETITDYSSYVTC